MMMVIPQEPPIPGWLVILSIIIAAASSLLGVAFSSWRHRFDEERRRVSYETQHKAWALQVVRDYTSGDEYTRRKDTRMIEVADMRIDKAFRERASSFVDALAFDEFRKALDQRLSVIEEAVHNNTIIIGSLPDKIAANVADAVVARIDPDSTAARRRRDG